MKYESGAVEDGRTTKWEADGQKKLCFETFKMDPMVMGDG
jgi:hypothetical protein